MRGRWKGGHQIQLIRVVQHKYRPWHFKTGITELIIICPHYSNATDTIADNTNNAKEKQTATAAADYNDNTGDVKLTGAWLPLQLAVPHEPRKLTLSRRMPRCIGRDTQQRGNSRLQGDRSVSYWRAAAVFVGAGTAACIMWRYVWDSCSCCAFVSCIEFIWCLESKCTTVATSLITGSYH